MSRNDRMADSHSVPKRKSDTTATMPATACEPRGRLQRVGEAARLTLGAADARRAVEMREELHGRFPPDLRGEHPQRPSAELHRADTIPGSCREQ